MSFSLYGHYKRYFLPKNLFSANMNIAKPWMTFFESLMKFQAKLCQIYDYNEFDYNEFTDLYESY